MEWQNASLIGDGSKNSESQRRITEAPIIDLYPKKEFSVPALPFLTVFEKLDIPALVIESDGKIWCVNQLLCKYFGVSEFDCNGKILYSLIPGLKNWVENEMSNCVPAELKLQLDAEAAVKKIALCILIRWLPARKCSLLSLCVMYEEIITPIQLTFIRVL